MYEYVQSQRYAIVSFVKASHYAVRPHRSISSGHTNTWTISSNAARTIRIVHIINTRLPLVALQTRNRRTKFLGRADPGTVLRSATSSTGIMHARLIRETRRHASGITDPRLRHRRLGVDDADPAAVPPRRRRIAGIARIFSAYLSRVRALDVGDAAAEDGLWAVAGLLNREAG